jgi:hypothetical protein
VCVLRGSSVPVILRENGEDHYVNIGTCFVLGLIMRREQFWEAKQSSVKEFFFLDIFFVKASKVKSSNCPVREDVKDPCQERD